MNANSPTPEEIKERCARIRSEWDERTYRQRAGELPATGSNQTHWTTPVVQVWLSEATLAG